MAKRRQIREWIVQLLFQLDINPNDDLEIVFSGFWGREDADANAREKVEQFVRGVWGQKDELDARLREYSEHWDMSRMGVVDRNVMRLAAYEMIYCDDIPPIVSINEAVDIAKYFSNDESGRFVNGILDGLSKALNRPLREAKGERRGSEEGKAADDGGETRQDGVQAAEDTHSA